MNTSKCKKVLTLLLVVFTPEPKQAKKYFKNVKMLKYLINVFLVKMLKLINFNFKFHTQQFFLYFRLT